MRRSTLAVLLLTALVAAGCAKKSSLYLDSGQAESSRPQAHRADTAQRPAAPAAAGASHGE
jgi:hypothetical protein